MRSSSRGRRRPPHRLVLNLRDDPEVEVAVQGGPKRRMRARSRGDERTELWQRLTSKHDNYAGTSGRPTA